MNEQNTEKIFQALVSPILLAGVPRQFAIFNGTLCAALVIVLQNIYVLPICLVLHMTAMVITKKDPYFFSVIIRHLRQADYYDV